MNLVVTSFEFHLWRHWSLISSPLPDPLLDRRQYWMRANCKGVRTRSRKSLQRPWLKRGLKKTLLVTLQVRKRPWKFRNIEGKPCKMWESPGKSDKSRKTWESLGKPSKIWKSLGKSNTEKPLNEKRSPKEVWYNTE